MLGVDYSPAIAVGFNPADVDAMLAVIAANNGTTNVRAVGGIGDFATDDTGAFRRAVSLTPSGGVLVIPPPSVKWRLTDNIPIPKPMTVIGFGRRPIVQQVTTLKEGFLVQSSGVAIQNLALIGPSYAAEQVTGSGVRTEGTSAAAYREDFLLEDCELANWSYGSYAQFVRRGNWRKNYIHDCYYAGIMGKSIEDFEITGGSVETISATPNAYGVSLTRSSGAGLATFPRSQRGRVHHMIIRHVTNWEAVDTHGGADIEIDNILTDDCGLGCEVTSDAVDNIPPQRVKVHDCTFVAGANTLHQAAAEIIGLAGFPAADCSIQDCVSIGYGLSNFDAYAAYALEEATRPSFKGNKAYDSFEGGLALRGTITDLNVDDFHVNGLTNAGATVIAAVKCVAGSTVSGAITGVTGDVGNFPGIRTVPASQVVRVSNNPLFTGNGDGYYPDPTAFQVRQDVRGVYRNTNQNAALTPDVTRYEVYYATVTAAIGIAAPIGTKRYGDRCRFIFTQGGAGAFGIGWNATFKQAWSDVGNATGKVSAIEFEWNGANWIQIGAQQPYL